MARANTGNLRHPTDPWPWRPFCPGALALSATQAGAVNPSVSSACASDYIAYCSQHPTEGPGVRRCMRANGPRLSATCVNALIAAGEVSRQEVARRANAEDSPTPGSAGPS